MKVNQNIWVSSEFDNTNYSDRKVFKSKVYEIRDLHCKPWKIKQLILHIMDHNGTYMPRSFKTRNAIFQTGNVIISPTSRPLIKEQLLKNVSHLVQGFQNQVSKQEIDLSWPILTHLDPTWPI